ncbi:MAG TPA: hypothetical protein VLJ39_01685, partial [Tepidisphaeraceae bacterium]|nr:hypothetical protein [Tepidisphaeraceae bacterium]
MNRTRSTTPEIAGRFFFGGRFVVQHCNGFRTLRHLCGGRTLVLREKGGMVMGREVKEQTMRVLLLVLLVTALLICTSAMTPTTALASGVGGVLLAHSEGQMQAPESDVPHFVRWVGHFHPPITAFPIAMLVGAAIAEALRMSSKAN